MLKMILTPTQCFFREPIQVTDSDPLRKSLTDVVDVDFNSKYVCGSIDLDNKAITFGDCDGFAGDLSATICQGKN